MSSFGPQFASQRPPIAHDFINSQTYTFSPPPLVFKEARLHLINCNAPGSSSLPLLDMPLLGKIRAGRLSSAFSFFLPYPRQLRKRAYAHWTMVSTSRRTSRFWLQELS